MAGDRRAEVLAVPSVGSPGSAAGRDRPRRRRLEEKKERALRHLRGWMRRRARPRAEMSLLLALTALAGFLASALLLQLGLGSMALRYPLAVVAAYIAFLLLLRGFVARSLYGRRRDWDGLDLIDLPSGGGPVGAEPIPHELGGGSFGGGGAGGSFDAPAAADWAGSAADLGTTGGGDSSMGEGVASTVAGAVSDADEAWPLVLAVGAVVALVAATAALLATAIYAAPALLAEVLLDAAIVGGMMRRLRGIEPRSWAVGVVRRTWLPVTALALVLAAGGWLLTVLVPGADSVGDVFRAS